MIHIPCLVVLEVMWGEARAEAPGLYRINPENFSGRRLHYLLGHKQFLVTNACREMVAAANHKGTPDPKRLARNLQRCTYDLLLICGKVAYKTYTNCDYTPDCRVLIIKHPAARDWTREQLAHLKGVLSAYQPSS